MQYFSYAHKVRDTSEIFASNTSFLLTNTFNLQYNSFKNVRFQLIFYKRSNQNNLVIDPNLR